MFVQSTASLQRRVTPQRVSWYDTKPTDGEIPVILVLLGIRSVLLLPPLPGPLWQGVLALDSILSMAQIELNCVLMLN